MATFYDEANNQTFYVHPREQDVDSVNKANRIAELAQELFLLQDKLGCYYRELRARGEEAYDSAYFNVLIQQEVAFFDAAKAQFRPERTPYTVVRAPDRGANYYVEEDRVPSMIEMAASIAKELSSELDWPTKLAIVPFVVDLKEARELARALVESNRADKKAAEAKHQLFLVPQAEPQPQPQPQAEPQPERVTTDEVFASTAREPSSVWPGFEIPSFKLPGAPVAVPLPQASQDAYEKGAWPQDERVITEAQADKAAFLAAARGGVRLVTDAILSFLTPKPSTPAVDFQRQQQVDELLRGEIEARRPVPSSVPPSDMSMPW